MKWKRKLHKDEEIRIIKKFLFFPLCIKDDCRWFETVSIKQKLGVYNYDSEWENIKFID
jgi:hypothetical protein